MIDIERAALSLLPAWQNHQPIQSIPADCRPQSREEGYAVQAALVRACNEPAIGWKIAATSSAGQAHLGVTGPLAGRLLASRCLQDGATVPLNGNAMRVAEAEFAFRMKSDVSGNPDMPLGIQDVMSAVASMHLAIEIPNSRFEDFSKAGEAQLIADFAGACFLVLGPEISLNWREIDLKNHEVRMFIDENVAAVGNGGNVLGDPRLALTWIANELISHGQHLSAGDVIITGTSIVPAPIAPGNTLRADFGVLGSVSARIG